MIVIFVLAGLHDGSAVGDDKSSHLWTMFGTLSVNIMDPTNTLIFVKCPPSFATGFAISVAMRQARIMFFEWPDNVFNWLKRLMVEKKYLGYETSDAEKAKRWHEGIVARFAQNHSVPDASLANIR
ncbi:hypothetical protein M405DRAFT_846245 [Rhizopogon salebrosus TDB-379]|nr:hypothetical protein M405DRAFT_846245 [Rhizopogon salebrosus TDB-379]